MSEKQKILHEIRVFLILGWVVGCQLVVLVGLTGQLKLADPPSYRSVSTNLLNPWQVWCTPNESCYGTGWNHWGGPYSIFWYWANAAMTFNGLLPLTPVLYVVNILIQTRLKTSLLAIPWAFNAIFCILGWPQNMIIMWLILLGFWNKWGLVLAPIFKLPFGSFQLWVWNIAFNSHTAVRDPGNWFSYLWLIIWWMAAFSKSYIWSRKPKPVNGTDSSSQMLEA